MPTLLVLGLVIVGLLVGASALQWLLRRLAARRERRLPHVHALAAAALDPAAFPRGLPLVYAGPVTNARLARSLPNEIAALDEMEQLGRVIGYRQLFRDPRLRGELLDVLLNLTVRRGRAQRLLSIDLSLHDDADGARKAIEAAPPGPDAGDDDDSDTIRVTSLDGHGLDFAASVRQWSRLAVGGAEIQRKIEVRWCAGRVAAVVAGDSEPPDGVALDQVARAARAVHARLGASPLATERAAASA